MDHVTVRLHGDLADLAGSATARVPVAGGRSAKDAVESLGVPHTEVALLVVGDRSVGFDTRLGPGDLVTAWPVGGAPPTPASRVLPDPLPGPPRFVADVHLGTLARRLRLLGLDTWWSNDADDPYLAGLAGDEGRVLLTRDRHLLMRRVVRHGTLVRDDDPEVQLSQVVARHDLRTAVAPRTRCVRCNGLLEQVDPAEVADRLEPGTRAAGFATVARCRACARLYWPGAHDDALDRLVARALRVPPSAASPMGTPPAGS